MRQAVKSNFQIDRFEMQINLSILDTRAAFVTLVGEEKLTRARQRGICLDGRFSALIRPLEESTSIRLLSGPRGWLSSRPRVRSSSLQPDASLTMSTWPRPAWMTPVGREVAAFKSPRLATRPIRWKGLTRHIYLVQKRERALSIASQSLKDWLFAHRPRIAANAWRPQDLNPRSGTTAHGRRASSEN
jgi:hypothetical protein